MKDPSYGYGALDRNSETFLGCFPGGLFPHQVLRNLEVSIRAVHIRLEWDAAPFPFACGVCLATATLSRRRAGAQRGGGEGSVPTSPLGGCIFITSLSRQ